MAQTPETRQFGTGSPMIRISNASTHVTERIIVFDDFSNEPFVNTFDWPLHHQAAPTEVDTGKIYTHVDGVRFHAAMIFNYWHEDYEASWPGGIFHQAFNEHDFAWLLRAQCGTAYDIEFFPSESIPQGTAPNAAYQCHILTLSRTRADDNAFVWNCALEVEGINIVAAADIPVS